MNEVINNIITRRSIRSFQDKQIPLEDLRLILLAGSYAPTGMGMQSWKFTAIQNQELLAKINQVMRNTLLSIPEDDQNYTYFYPHIKKALNVDVNFLFHAPTYVIVSNLSDNKNAMADSALAIGNMMLAAHSLGIGSCWLNQLPRLTHFQEIRNLLTELEIPENHLVYGSVVFGYPQEFPDPRPRKDVIKIYQ
ncbi:MAG TPA: nitroreductase family protein [Bacilli bacterium]